MNQISSQPKQTSDSDISKEIPKLILKLRSDDLDQLNQTVEALMGQPLKALPFLIEAMQSKDIEIRKNAAWLLGSLRQLEAIPVLLSSMSYDSSIDVKLSAAWALRNFSLEQLNQDIFKETTPPQTQEHIFEGLSHESWYVRWYSTVLLSKQKNLDFLDELLRLVRDEEHIIVRCSAILTLMLYSGKPVSEALCNLLNNINDHVKIEAATALSLRGYTPAIPMMIKQLKAYNENVRITMIVALGSLGSIKLIPYLIHMLKDKSDLVRINTTMALMDLVQKQPHSNPELSKELLKSLDDNNIYVVRNAARTLAIVGEEEVFRSIGARLKTETRPEVITHFVYALSFFFDNRSLKIYQRLLRHEHWEVRFEVVKALGQLEHPKIFKLLLQALKDKSLRVREQAVYGLGILGNDKAIPPLEKLKLQHPYGKINKAIGVALERLLEF